MKNTFPFYLFLFGLGMYLTQAQNIITNTSDSLYNLSRDKDLPVNQRIEHINTAIQITDKSILKLKYLSYKAAIYGNNNKFANAIAVSQNLFNEAQKVNDTFYMAKANYKLGLNYKHQHIYDSSYYYFHLANRNFSQIKDSLNWSKSLNNLGYLNYINGNYYNTEKQSVDALKIVPENNKKFKYQLHMQLGISSRELQDYDSATTWYLMALKNSQTSIDSSNTYNSLGVKEQYLGNHSQAIHYFNKALLIETNNTSNQLRIRSNKTYSEGILNNEMAISDLVALSQKRFNNNDLLGSYSSTIQLVKLLQFQNKNNEAISYAQKAYTLAIRINSAEAKIESLGYLIDLKSINNTEARQFKHLVDSIAKARINLRTTFDKIQFQTENKEKENLQLKADNTEQELLTKEAKTRNWLLAFGLLALCVSAFFIWRRYKSEAKAKIQIEKLQREFHHRLKNDFRSINSFISLVQKQFPNTEFEERLNELKNRVTSMFKVHEMLLKEDDITQIKSHPYLFELAQNVEDKYKDSNITLLCSVDKTETILADKAIPFGIVLNEFVTNSYKYAFDENGGEITIDFKSDKDNHQLTLKDNGKGLPKDFDIDNLRSLGMSIIPMFADLHNGSYQLDGSNGVCLILTLPKKIA
ncbi:tetratricopeptide repeat-containing sensor histidine kinase [Psychroserpens luteus]|uniref:histidine kinase n=1 Tax=Psychroserpens luteus TaxID=1434066 RepID=A0ABW5ZY21_9FLAO|nr:histidine kinase dimerization/phosphoacceptor domain -containing protein [Psychroserpens luteus]